MFIIEKEEMPRPKILKVRPFILDKHQIDAIAHIKALVSDDNIGKMQSWKIVDEITYFCKFFPSIKPFDKLGE
jgi:hypothetical protein